MSIGRGSARTRESKMTKPLYVDTFATEEEAIRAIETQFAAIAGTGLDTSTIAAVLDTTPRANGVTAAIAPRTYLLRNGTPSNFPHFADGDLLVVAVRARRRFGHRFADIPLKELVAALNQHEAK